VLFTLLVAASFAQGSDSVDVLIRRGTVYDGSGEPGRVTDVGIRGDRIVFVGDAAQSRVRAGRTIEAQGLVVSPGFIDPHNGRWYVFYVIVSIRMTDN
jgi:N-acyl-D-aspartate/D-glutamate deacylase